MKEITKTPLVDILTKKLGEQVAMSGTDYVLLRDKSIVDSTIVEEAIATQEEMFVQAGVDKQIQEANTYLKDTDWVEAYKLRHELGVEMLPEDSSKWSVINKREEYKLFLQGV